MGKSKSLQRQTRSPWRWPGNRPSLGHDGNDRRSRPPLPLREETPPGNSRHKVLALTTYQRLEEYLSAFAKGHFHLLILVGAGGLAKSRSVRAVLDGKACWIEGNATPFGMYAKLYRHRDEFVVIDDVDALYADRSGVRLLKCLCQTEEEKAVAWHSTRGAWSVRASRGSSPPRAGSSSSPTTGRPSTRTWRRSRTGGMCSCSSPARPRSTRQAGKWFDDQEIYQWFAANLHRVREPSLRHYVRAKELKAAGMDWTEVLAAEDENPRARLAAELLASDAYGSTAARVKAFVEQGGGCRATFFNYRRKLGGV